MTISILKFLILQKYLRYVYVITHNITVMDLSQIIEWSLVTKWTFFSFEKNN